MNEEDRVIPTPTPGLSGAPAGPPLFDLSSASAPQRARGRWLFTAGIVAVLAIAAAIIIVAGRDGDGARAVLTLAEAAQHTEDQHTARVEFTTSVPLAGLSGSEVLATGEIDFDTSTVHYTLDVSDAIKTLNPDVPPGSGKMTAVAHEYTIYMSMAAFDEVPALKGKWLKLDIAAAGAQFGVDFDKIAKFEASGPTSALAKLEVLGGVVDNLGREDVRGVATTHYRASYDFAKLYRDHGAVTDEAAFAKLLAVYSSSEIVNEAWVDDDGLVRRTVQTVPLKAGVQRVKAEFFDFGVKVDARIPADADTFDANEIASLAGK